MRRLGLLVAAALFASAFCSSVPAAEVHSAKPVKPVDTNASSITTQNGAPAAAMPNSGEAIAFKDSRFQALTAAQQKQALAFITGNVVATVLHEAGHMMISEFDLKVLGHEEDAADDFATLFMLDNNDPIMPQALRDTVDSQIWLGQAADANGEAPDYTDEHATDYQRAYFMLCLMVGKSPEKYKKYATSLEMASDRQETCVDDYDQAADAWDSLLKPHLRASGQTKFTLRYGKSENRDSNFGVEYARKTKVLERLTALVDRRYELDDGIVFEMTSCDQDANATWYQETRTMTLCYEYIDFYLQQFIDNIKKRGG